MHYSGLDAAMSGLTQEKARRVVLESWLWKRRPLCTTTGTGIVAFDGPLNVAVKQTADEPPNHSVYLQVIGMSASVK
jgi:hypothetical protein